MGNTIGGSKKAKVMKIDGETFKLKTPTTTNDVVKGYPGYVLLDSQAVKSFGLRAKPLELSYELKPKKLYFLVELPKFQLDQEKAPLPRRVQSSGIRGMNAKDRLDFLMLSKRSISDLNVTKPSYIDGPNPNHNGPMRVKMRLPKAQLDRLVEECHGGAEVAEKIISLYMGNNGNNDGGGAMVEGEATRADIQNHKPRRKRVSFRPVEQGENHLEAVPM
ncbi:hypothetical protein TanjilG_23860 [Lupinus angustifolius]|uniref:Plastid movement impaired protein n=1 Tax=Lupinus angustifolius TaxID=3871 RepID=A0A4P1QVP1_LUPAN|nr:PREDICTED: uncharacterized protein At1g66480-like [Lupinus angustifolius]OIV95629.1 hypothetical protein TanjilG_23860 [Lupinus angustifolius]